MTVDEKRDRIDAYCGSVACGYCLLKNRTFEKPFNSLTGYKCLDIETAPESDLDKALAIIDDKEAIEKDNEVDDPINPKHYKTGKIEVIEFIEDKNLGYCLGNAVKYIARAGKKDPTKEIEDLKKAEWYVKRRIKELEEA